MRSCLFWYLELVVVVLFTDEFFVDAMCWSYSTRLFHDNEKPLVRIRNKQLITLCAADTRRKLPCALLMPSVFSSLSISFELIVVTLANNGSKIPASCETIWIVFTQNIASLNWFTTSSTVFTWFSAFFHALFRPWSTQAYRPANAYAFETI